MKHGERQPQCKKWCKIAEFVKKKLLLRENFTKYEVLDSYSLQNGVVVEYVSKRENKAVCSDVLTQ